MSLRVFVIAIAVIAGAASGAAARQQTVANPYDEVYVQELALEAIAALELGYDALERSARDDVRNFALDNVNLHAPALKELEWFATERRIALPRALADHPEYAIERPWKDETVGFDRAFMEHQVRLLERESVAITRVATFAEDPDLRALAWSRLAVVRQRLARAQEIIWQLDLDDVR